MVMVDAGLKPLAEGFPTVDQSVDEAGLQGIVSPSINKWKKQLQVCQDLET